MKVTTFNDVIALRGEDNLTFCWQKTYYLDHHKLGVVEDLMT
jgi:hypothetical protein